ncbi:MAG: SUMF1/EgtB/PvdO family nonheme iron enzyme, partial [Kangiellaceae bacterium]|nr:SUMF1/EgtB/PvdO family nonheme iron enzyme [Kangiellaceae bacterium]
PIMVTIPSGSFEMGSTQRESTQPVHTVNIKEFSMGKYEVTVKEFRQFIEATNYPAPTECRHELDGWFKLASKGNWEANALNTSEFQPVVCINWKAADAYVKWLAKETGRPYRLASESEWEYAARAGTTTDYFFGDDKDRTKVCEYANTADLYGENILQRDVKTSYYNWDTGMSNCVDHSAYASIVGMYKPNQFGLHDMVSNVLEYLADCFVDNYEGAPTDGSPRLDGKCERRATRGGSWHWNNWPLAFRGRIGPDFAGGVDGFRIALDGSAPKQSKATKRFAKELKHAQTVEQKQRDLIAEFPKAVSNLKIKQKGNFVKLSWDKSNSEGVEGYRIYRNRVSGNMFTLLASNITDSSFTDSNVGPYKYDYTVVAVRNHLQSNYAEPVTTQAGWTSISDKVEAEWASEFSGTAISFSSDDNDRGGSVLTGSVGISEEAVIKYQIDAPKSGTYQLEYRVATPRDTKGFELLANDKSAGKNKVVKTGGYHDWATQKGVSVFLKKGKNTLTLKSLDQNWKLNWLQLKLK